MKIHILSISLLLAILSTIARAADPPTPATEAEPSRLKEMETRIDALELTTTGAEPRRLQRSDRAILRYSNSLASPAGQGATFLWLDGKRPLAAISLSYRGEGRIWWELSSLSDDSLQLRQDEKLMWEPVSSSRAFQRFPDAPIPAQSTAARLTQMRDLARKLNVKEYRREKWQEGRLLTQPLYRWSDEERGTTDGAVFAIAETTDPELLLVIEARKATGDSPVEWRFALGKMTSAPMIVTLGEKEILNVPGYWISPRSPKDPYAEKPIGVYEQQPSSNP